MAATANPPIPTAIPTHAPASNPDPITGVGRGAVVELGTTGAFIVMFR